MPHPKFCQACATPLEWIALMEDGGIALILSAAERGFKGKPYKKVYTDYRTVAEQQINKDKIPDGYRFYVHRYFQLIRPRE